MKRLIIYTLIFSALIWGFFVDHSAKSAYVPLKEGLLYSSSVSSSTILGDEVTEKILFKRDAADDYPTITAASTENLPEKFFVRLTNNDSAQYKIVTAAFLAAKVQASAGAKKVAAAPRPAAPKPVNEEMRKAATEAVTIKKPAAEEVLNINKVRDIVDNSEKNYFFPNGGKILNDVTLVVKSVTPWENKSILTLELDNAQGKYFFISNISVIQAGAPLPLQHFNEAFYIGNQKAPIFLIVRQLKGEAVVVKLSEQGGGGRVFEIPVSIP